MIELKTKNVVLIGRFGSVTRKQAVERLEAKGAKVAKTVTKKTDLVFADGRPCAQLERAKVLGFDILGEEELRGALASPSAPSTDGSPSGLWVLLRATARRGEIESDRDLQDDELGRIGRIATLEPCLAPGDLTRWDGQPLAGCRLRIGDGDYGDSHGGEGPFIAGGSAADAVLAVYDDDGKHVFGVDAPMQGRWQRLDSMTLSLRNEKYGDLYVFEECALPEREGGELVRTILGVTDCCYYDRWDLFYRRATEAEATRSDSAASAQVTVEAASSSPAADSVVEEPAPPEPPSTPRPFVRGGVWGFEGGSAEYDYAWPSGRAVQGSAWVFCDVGGAEVLRSDLAFVDDFVEDRARVFTDAGWGFIDRSGQLVGRSDWQFVHQFTEGRALVCAGGVWGYADVDGRVVIEPQWDAAYAFCGGVAIVRRGALFGLIDPGGATLVEPRWDYCGLPSEGRARVRGTSVSVPGASGWGLVDERGVEVVPARHKGVGDFHGGFTRVGGGTEWGLVDLDGKAIWPIAERFVDGPDPGGYVVVREGRKWGYVDASGSYVIAPKFKEARVFVGDTALAQTGKGWGVIDRRGAWVVPPTFRRLGKSVVPGVWHGHNRKKRGILGPDFMVPPIYDSARAPTEGLVAASLDGRAGFVDAHTGEVVIDFEFLSVDAFSDGLALARDPSTGLGGYIDRTGRWVIESRFGTGFPFVQGVAWALPNGSSDGVLIDAEGETLATCRGANPHIGHEGVFRELVRGSAGQHEPRPHLDRHGERLHSKAEGVLPFDGGLGWVTVGGAAGWMSRTGKLLFEP